MQNKKKIDWPFGEIIPKGGWTPHRLNADGKCCDPKNCERIECADAWADENFERKRPRPCPEHVPLIVTPQLSKKNDGSVIAFVGRQMAFFERYKSEDDPQNRKQIPEPMPEIGKPIEVMATRAMFRYRSQEQGGGYDYDNVLAILIRPVTEFRLVRHGGFECSGSMCQTTATSYKDDGDLGAWMTPGRTMIFEAGNVNSGRTWGQKYTAKRPGHVWVSKSKFERGEFPLRAEGVSRIEDTLYWRGVKK